MSSLSLDHVNIVTSELELTRAFYCDVLGLSVGYRPAFKVEGYWLYADDRPIIHLQAAPDGGAGSGAGPGHYALRVTSLAAFTERLERAGVAYRRTMTPDRVFDQVFLQDPSGAWLELICPRMEA